MAAIMRDIMITTMTATMITTMTVTQMMPRREVTIPAMTMMLILFLKCLFTNPALSHKIITDENE